MWHALQSSRDTEQTAPFHRPLQHLGQQLCRSLRWEVEALVSAAPGSDYQINVNEEMGPCGRVDFCSREAETAVLTACGQSQDPRTTCELLKDADALCLVPHY